MCFLITFPLACYFQSVTNAKAFVFCQYTCLDYSAEVPIDSVETRKPEKGVGKSLTHITENRTKVPLDIGDGATVVSIPTDVQYNQDLKSSSRSEGRYFLYRPLYQIAFCFFLFLFEYISITLLFSNYIFRGYYHHCCRDCGWTTCLAKEYC